MNIEQLVIRAAIELVRVLVGGAAAFAKALNVPQDKIDQAIEDEWNKLKVNDPGNLKVPE